MSRTLRIDIETYSSYDLTEVGVYKYVEAPDFEVLILGYSYDDEPKKVIDVYAQKADEFWSDELDQILDDLQNPDIIKKAFNANFEITCLSKYFYYKYTLDAKQWRCTAVHALQIGLPGNLDGVAKALGLEEQKDAKGKSLITYFCKPCKPTKTNGMRTRNLPEHDPEKWAEFMEYCRQDVVVEHEIDKRLSHFPVPDAEWELWQIDQKINNTGVLIDMALVEGAVAVSDEYTEELVKRATKLTGLDNPNSITQLKWWIEDNEGIEIPGVTKDSVKDLLAQDIAPQTREVLQIRQALGKTSVTKYQAMQRAVCEDGRVRGLLQFYGANRTGRWAGRLIQVQNLTKHRMKDPGVARELVKYGDVELIKMLFGNPQDILSQLVRTAIIAPNGSRFIVSDFSAIEARVIAWLAGEKWRLDVFETHGKIYEASASQMFKVPIESIDKHSPLRQKGKVAELALGYQGGPNALRAMDKKWAASASEAELKELVDTWRTANPKIVQLWADCEELAIATIRTGRPQKFRYGMVFSYESGCLFIQLPSGRRLCYAKAKLEKDPRWGKDQISYWGTDTKGWSKLSTYGGKIVENIIQAIARDCLAESILKLDRKGFIINMHVHDEVVIEEPYSGRAQKEVTDIMGESIDWAPGLPLRADAYETEYYMKD